MAGMVKLTDRKFKMTVINILRDLMDKADHMPKHIVNVSRERKILK